LLAAALLASACTTIGHHDADYRESIDFGPREDVAFCVLAEDGIEQAYTTELLDAWNTEEGPLFELYVRPASFARRPRGGFTFRAILADVEQVPLGPECEKVIYFVGRNLGDSLYQTALWTANLFVPLPVPEVYGAVNGQRTHGFVVAEIGGPGDLVHELFGGRSGVTVHELYHYFGCDHSWWSMHACYGEIRAFKRRR
jgi:hypothetical protein